MTSRLLLKSARQSSMNIFPLPKQVERLPAPGIQSPSSSILSKVPLLPRCLRAVTNAPSGQNH
jgi:hypothetical protein